MKRFTLGLAATLALALPAAVQAAPTVQVNFSGSPTAIPGNNDFQGKLATLGLTNYVALGASLILSEEASIKFEFLGSESGYSDTFSVAGGGISYTETSEIEDHFGFGPPTPGSLPTTSPINLGSLTFSAGSLKNILLYTSNYGDPATVGDPGFGIFLEDGQQSGSNVTTFYLGYDDYVRNTDDNHDDFIIRATVSPVPEPATWAMLLFGFGVAGMAMRSRSRRVNTRVSFV